MTKSFLAIDELTREEHVFLEPNDMCFYYGEYTSRSNYRAGPINDRVSNFKKGPGKKGTPEWRWREWAVCEIANALLDCWSAAFFTDVTWVPVPPSKAKEDPLYDDRLLAVFEQIRQKEPLVDVRELVIQTKSLDSFHKTKARRNPDILVKSYQFQPQFLTPPLRDMIVIFDDILTTGSHYRAMVKMIHLHVPSAKIIGVFYARAVPKSDLMIDVDSSTDDQGGSDR